MRQLAVRASVVDGAGKLLRQDLGDLIDRDVVLGGELPNGIAAQHLLQLFRGDRQVLAIADPGLHLVAETRLLQLGNDSGKSALTAVAQYLAQHHRQNSALQLSECAL